MKDILQNVDRERLYEHVKSIEGVKHHMVNPQKLNETADYILEEFQKYGLKTNVQTFRVEGTDMDFRNIEGYLGDPSEPEILVTSHYDTVQNSPGADDNGSAVAAMLEAARVLASKNFKGNVRFVSFTLEEVEPTTDRMIIEKAMELDIVDQNLNFASESSKKKIFDLITSTYIRLSKGQSMFNAWQKSFDEIESSLTDIEKQYCEYILKINQRMTRTSWIGQHSIVGSTNWVKKATKENKKILGVINLESVGYTNEMENSQIVPPLVNPRMFPTYEVNVRKKIGNFISVISDKNSKKLGKIFCKNCRIENIKLPYFWVRIPLKFKGMARWFIDLLRSDHAPFWKEDIPALMLTDTANFRNPFYHGEEDTIDKLDFDFIRKVTQATVATVIKYLENTK